MTTAIIIGIVLVLLLGVLLLVSQVQVWRERKETALELAKKGPHVHSWRKITEFARRCSVCGANEISPDAPDGLGDYIGLMTTTLAGKNPVQEAEIYRNLDPRMMHGEGTSGKMCEECFRVYPKQFPWCPYCDVRPIPHMVFNEGTKEYEEATPATLLRLEQERKERLRYAKLTEQRAIDSQRQRADSGNKN